MSARHDNADGPEDIDAAFAEIVAGLEQEAPLAQWPDEQAPQPWPTDSAGPTDSPAPAEPPRSIESPGPIEPAPAASSGPRDWSVDDEEDEGHFVPPEPPPLPKPRASTLGAAALVLVGALLLIMPGLAGAASTVSLPLGLVAISAGIGWLLFRMRHGPPHHDEDDGAQL